mmetsp:Transcript_4966/g.10254  ORF Transcript_4966/g.10254 Transcript_4966/m.10254 type:complete len:99 (+) Transcript_4966:80-376(+)
MSAIMRIVAALFLITLTGADTSGQGAPVVAESSEVSQQFLQQKVSVAPEAKTEMTVAEAAEPVTLIENPYTHTTATAEALAGVFAGIALMICWIECCK